MGRSTHHAARQQWGWSADLVAPQGAARPAPAAVLRAAGPAPSSGPAVRQRTRPPIVRAKLLGIAVMAAAAAVIPSLTAYRVTILVILGAVAAPLLVCCDRLAPSAWSNQAQVTIDVMTAIGAVFFVPGLWPAAAVVIGVEVASVATLFGLRLCLALAALGWTGLAVAAALAHPAPPHAALTLTALGLVLPSLTVIACWTAQREHTASRRLDEVVDAATVLLWESDLATGEMLSVSGNVVELLGYTPQEWLTLDSRTKIHPDDLDGYWISEAHGLEPGQLVAREARIRHKDGHYVWVRDLVRRSPGPGSSRLLGVLFDITPIKQAQAELTQYLDVVSRLPIAVLICRLGDRSGDSNGDSCPAAGLTVTKANPAAARLLGPGASPLGPPRGALARLLADPRAADALAEGAVGRPASVARAEIPAESGARRILDVEVVPLPDRHVALTLADVTESALAERTVRWQAEHDPLTGLANRSTLMNRLDQALETSARTGAEVALLLMDLNRFKEVNDEFGHVAGDELLREVADRLRSCLRASDLVARLGGDEFAILLTRAGDQRAAEEAAGRLGAVCAKPVPIEGTAVVVAAATGIALAPQHGCDAASLLRRADAAMYEAKRAGAPYRVSGASPPCEPAPLRREAPAGGRRAL
ncbi:MAG: diguanylate cyclase domain-containing protein [Acidimicrobiales bacterium]